MCGVRQDIYIMFEYLNNSNTLEALLKDTLVRGSFTTAAFTKPRFSQLPYKLCIFRFP